MVGRWLTSGIAAVLVVAAVGTASAEPQVFINGVNVGYVRDTRLQGCTVDFDSQGNVRITAPDYKIVSPASTAQAGPASNLTRKYFLTTQTQSPGAAQYVFHLYVNGKMVRTIQSNESGLVVELNPYLESGKNTVGIKAYKEIVGQRLSTNPSDTFGILIGEGSGQGDTLVMRDIFVRYSRSAAEMTAHQDVYTIVAQ